MRILNVHNYYTGSGGEDTVFHSLSALLRSHGHEVFEYVESNKRIESMNKVSVALQTLWSFSSYRKLQEFLKETTPDLVHFHNTFPLISPSAYYACQELEIPVLQNLDNQRLMCPAATFHRKGTLCLDCLGKTPPWPGVVHACYHDSRLHTMVVAAMLTFHRWIRTWQRKVDIFLCSTRFYRELFMQAGLPSEKLMILPHFVHESIVSAANRGVGDYALFVGRLDPEKGVRTLLDAWRLLNIPLKIRGNGQLDRIAKEHVSQHKMQNVELIPRLNETDLSKLMANARFLVWPSEGYYETFGLTAVESFAMGRPVIASRIGVMQELVEDHKTGLLFTPGDSADLAAKSEWLWNHPEECVRMGQNGRRAYEEKYTPERHYRTLIDIYSGAIEKKRK